MIILAAKRRSCSSSEKSSHERARLLLVYVPGIFRLMYIWYHRSSNEMNGITKETELRSTTFRSSFAVRACYCSAASVLVLCLVANGCRSSRQQQTASQAKSTETIVVLRHGEKPPGGLGQLSCMGLNRALALPKVLIGRFGHADAIFAPDPAEQVGENWFPRREYSYVRPLATIEPTAIQLGLAVNAQLGFRNIAGLQSAVTAPAYANSTVFIAWEHKYAYDFARQMLRSYGVDPSQVPGWPSDDFETLYVLHITRAAGSSPVMTFAVQKEGLQGTLSATCPSS
jgi:hypothetical protein